MIKKKYPNYLLFFREDIKKYLDEKTLEIYGYKGEKLEDVIKRRRQDFDEKNFPTYTARGYYELSDKYNIPMDFAQRVFRSYRGSNPIKNIADYDRAKMEETERKQKAIMRQRQKNRQPRKKGQRKQNRQTSQKKTRSQRQATSQRKQNEQARRERERREDEQRRFRNERRGL